MIKDIKGKVHTAFGLAILAKFFGQSGKVEIRADGRNVFIGDKAIPVNKYSEMLINYVGHSGIFPQISFHEVWKRSDEDNSSYFTEKFKDKIVLIGTTNIMHQDFMPTPFFASSHYNELKSTYGIEIWANMINTVLSEDYIVRLHSWQIATIILFIGLIISGFALQFSISSCIIATLAICFGYIYICMYSFVHYNLWIDIIAPLLTIPLTFSVTYTYRYTTERKQRSRIKNLFQFYLHPSVVEELIKNPEYVKLGGVKKELTVFFSDIAGFTSIAETMAPEELVELINMYLTEMSSVIFKHGGTIDKYQGDAIMAFFGAPLDQDDHAVRACYSAIEMQKHLKDIKEKFRARGWPEIRCRIGINTGCVVVGNMGGANRFDYTVIGDDVNLAARLEGANKIYSTHIMIGEQTYEFVKYAVITRELDTVRVKGKSKPVKVYELMAKKDEADEKTIELLKHFGMGIDAYRIHDWHKAMEHFKSSANIDQEDGPSRVYINRCENYLKSPPPSGWDGVYEMETK